MAGRRSYGGVLLPEKTTPATPPSGWGEPFFKSDGRLYIVNDAGFEIPCNGRTRLSHATSEVASSIITTTSVRIEAITLAFYPPPVGEITLGLSISATSMAVPAAGGVVVSFWLQEATSGEASPRNITAQKRHAAAIASTEVDDVNMHELTIEPSFNDLTLLRTFELYVGTTNAATTIQIVGSGATTKYRCTAYADVDFGSVA